MKNTITVLPKKNHLKLYGNTRGTLFQDKRIGQYIGKIKYDEISEKWFFVKAWHINGISTERLKDILKIMEKNENSNS